MALNANITLKLLEEAFSKKETITSINSVILCDSIESVIELTYEDLNSEKIA